MDSQIQRQQQGQESNQVMEGEEDNRQEKTSVLKKVKAKARKIKDTIKAKAGHDRQDTTDHENQHDEEDEDGDDEEEMVEDSEVQDAVPMYESPAVMSTMAEQKPDDKIEKPATVAEDQSGSKYTDPQTRPFSQWPDENTGNHGEDAARSTGMGMAGMHVPPEKKDGSFSSSGTFGTPGSESAGNFVLGEGRHPKLSMESPTATEEDVADPTEAGHMGMGGPKISTERPTTMEEDPHAPNDRPQVPNYQSKVADPTGAGGEEAGITQVLQSFNKMNVSGEPESKSEGAPELYSGSHDQFSPEPIPPTSTNLEDTTPLDNVTKLPSNQSSYTEKISYASSAIADKAIAAKNVVVSKLGYGGNDDPNAESKAATQVGEETGKTGTMAGYGQKTVVAVTEKLAPVYDKVSNAGSSVVTPLYEKVSNVGSSVLTPAYEKASNVGNSVVSKVRGTAVKQDDAGVEGQDQGVSVKEYLAEKTRPGDEDKALSDAILGVLPKRKQEVDGERRESEKPSEGIVTESEEVTNRLGKDEDNREMTETESKVAGNVSATGKGMVESLKGTVSSWFSRGGDQKQSSEASPVTMPEQEQDLSANGEEAVDHGENGVGERRLQESSN